MEEKDLLQKLDELKKGLESKSAEQVKEEVKAIEEKLTGIASQNKEAFETELKGIKEQVEEKFKEVATKGDVQEIKEHVDKLDIKYHGKERKESEKETFKDSVKNLLESNIENLGKVRKGHSVEMEVKVVADMTLGNNLTGDQPRSYSNTVIAVPSQKINFADLLGEAININGGTYTFPRETASEGAIIAQVEGSAVSQIDYDVEMVDVSTDYLAGFANYSKKMANNLPYLQSFIPRALQRDYAKAENRDFNTSLEAQALPSTQLITGQNKIEMLINEVATLEALDNDVNGIVVRPTDWYDIAKTEKSTGAGYGLPGIVNVSNGQLTINGIPVFKATWLTANKYYVGDWTYVKKVVTDGLSLEVSNEDNDNFRRNQITAKIQAQIAMVLERSTAVIFGDFTAV